MAERLALLGGRRVIEHPFKRYNPIGAEEVQAAKAVVESGVLSQYLGAWHDDFYGGPKVREFEEACQQYFGVRHAVTVNSWTSGLIAAVGAIGIEPGDEVVVSPWTMCASATAIVHWNGIPVFADIEPDTFCLDPEAVEAAVTPRTRAIMAVDIFGQSAAMRELREIASRHNLHLLSDCAQAPGAYYHGQPSGTLADIGGYSLNYHKHIHTGEGGILVTNDDTLAERLRLIRNHGEAVAGPRGLTDIANLIGYNFRLGEIECAIGIEQLKKLRGLVTSRQEAAERLSAGLHGLPGLSLPVVRAECTHVYYIYPLVLDPAVTGVPRDRIHAALSAEGVPALAAGYQNVHLLPMYQQKVAYGREGFPWSAPFAGPVDYSKGICPVAERLHDETYLGLGLCMFEFNDAEVDLIVRAFRKVWTHLPALREESSHELRAR